MPHVDDNLAIGFSDIVGSSQLYATLGNVRAKAKIDSAILAMTRVVEHCQGQVIKIIGDEIMYSHSDPEQACMIAIQMNNQLNLMHFYLRTGIAFGRVIHDRNDIYGDTVNNASFMARTAQANQIIFDSNTYENLSLLSKQCDFFDRVALKGQSEHSLVYRLNWEANKTASLDATVVANTAVSAENGMATHLVVLHDGQSYIVDPNSTTNIGRDQGTVQICVQHKNASRKHCSLLYHRGKFILRDHSTNGTYLQQKGHREVFLRREATVLQASGKISIGQPCNEGAVILEYHLE